MSGDYKFAHSGTTATDAWLKSVGEDTVTKAALAIEAALSTLEDLVVRLDKLDERDAAEAAAAARSRREVTP